MPDPRPPRVRIFSTYEPPTSFFRDLTPRLVASGCEVEVVLSGADYRPGRGRIEAVLEPAGVRVTRIPAGVGSVGSTRTKLLAMGTYLVGAAGRSLARRSDLNVFLSNPPLFVAWGWVLRRLRGEPYVCSVQDIYPDVLVTSGAVDAGAPPTRLASRVMAASLRGATRVVAIGRCMRRRLADHGVPDEKLVVIPNWSPIAVDDFPPPRAELDHLVVQYSGNLGLSHTFDEILDVAVRFGDRDVPVRFVFVGDGSRRREVETAARDHPEARIELRPFAPADRLAESLGEADVHFISLRPGFEGIVVPSKAYGTFASGRPVVYLGDPSGEIARTIDERGCGAVVEPGDVDVLERALRHYLDADADRLAAGAAGAAASAGDLSPDAAIEAWRRLVCELVGLSAEGPAR